MATIAIRDVDFSIIIDPHTTWYQCHGTRICKLLSPDSP